MHYVLWKYFYKELSRFLSLKLVLNVEFFYLLANFLADFALVRDACSPKSDSCFDSYSFVLEILDILRNDLSISDQKPLEKK